MSLRFTLKKSVTGVVVRYDHGQNKVKEVTYPYEAYTDLDAIKDSIKMDSKIYLAAYHIDFTNHHLNTINDFFKDKEHVLKIMMDVYHDDNN